MEQEFTTFKIQEVVHVKRENMRIKTDCKETYVLSCRLSGESMFFYKGEAKKVIPGDVLYIPYGANYSQSCQAEEIVAIHLDVNGDMPKEMQIITTEDSEEMCLLFGEIAQAWKAKTTESFYRCMANLYKIVALTHIADDSCAKETYGVIDPAVRYLQGHLFDKDLAMDHVYRLCPVSQTSFIKHFRKHFGCTPVKYVNRQRIQKAQTLLRSQLYTREEIASLCGFENVKHFYVVFKAVAGCTTREYLKNKAIRDILQ